MAYNISIGNNARAAGLCCIAVGDDTLARGAYQIVVNHEKLTLPDTISVEDYERNLMLLEDNILTFNAMAQQGFAPVDFATRAEKLLTEVIKTIKTHVEALKQRNGEPFPSNGNEVAGSTGSNDVNKNVEREVKDA